MGEAGAKMLGRYQVLKHLASGGMAEVLIARATGIENFERHVVIKRIHSEQARDINFVKMFLDEARLAASLHHNNIVQVHDIGQENGEYFFTMDYVHGEDLRWLLTHLAGKHEQLPLQHVITIVTAAAAALHYAHELRGPDRKPLGIVHRDVSPANIIVAYDGVVKVVDFGIAKASVRSTKTHSGTLKGKIAYMSPEQCNGKAVDRRTDVFALGIVLYELLTVRRLFKADTDFLTMSAIVAGRIAKPSTFRPDLPKALEHIVMKALSHDPADRFQTADEMRLALEQFANSAGLRTSTTALADYMEQQFGRRPEPWLADDDHEMQIDVDFDGSGTGAAAVPSMTSGKYLVPNVEALGWGVGGDMPTTGNRTPVAWETSPPPASRSRLRWLLLALAAAGVTALVLATGIFSRDDSSPVEEQEPTSASAPAPTTAAPAPASGEAPAASASDPSGSAAPAQSTGSATTPAPAAEARAPEPAAGSAATPERPTKAAKPITKRKKPRQRATWNEDSMFPK